MSAKGSDVAQHVLAVWVMLYGNDVEEAEITMPISALLTGGSSE